MHETKRRRGGKIRGDIWGAFCMPHHSPMWFVVWILVRANVFHFLNPLQQLVNKQPLQYWHWSKDLPSLDLTCPLLFNHWEAPGIPCWSGRWQSKKVPLSEGEKERAQSVHFVLVIDATCENMYACNCMYIYKYILLFEILCWHWRYAYLIRVIL